MTTVDLESQQLLIGGEWRDATGGRANAGLALLRSHFGPGYRPRSIKQEIRDNLRARLANGGPEAVAAFSKHLLDLHAPKVSS